MHRSSKLQDGRSLRSRLTNHDFISVLLILGFSQSTEAKYPRGRIYLRVLAFVYLFSHGFRFVDKRPTKLNCYSELNSLYYHQMFWQSSYLERSFLPSNNSQWVWELRSCLVSWQSPQEREAALPSCRVLRWAGLGVFSTDFQACRFECTSTF